MAKKRTRQKRAGNERQPVEDGSVFVLVQVSLLVQVFIIWRGEPFLKYTNTPEVILTSRS